MPHFAQFSCILSPLLATLADTLFFKSFPCRSYEKHPGGGHPYKHALSAQSSPHRSLTSCVPSRNRVQNPRPRKLHGSQVTICDFNGFRFIKFRSEEHTSELQSQ